MIQQRNERRKNRKKKNNKGKFIHLKNAQRMPLSTSHLVLYIFTRKRNPVCGSYIGYVHSLVRLTSGDNCVCYLFTDIIMNKI